MTAPTRTATYNPGILAKDELIATFAARRSVLAILLDDVQRGGKQHHLLIGQRGAGKTTLLLRLAYAIEDDTELAGRAIPLRFPEEQYNVAHLSDFWLNCVDALTDALERQGDAAAARKLDAEVDRIEDLDEDERARAALAVLTGWAKKERRLLVLLVDNVDLVLQRLADKHWALRDVLSMDNGLMLIGASSTFIQASFDYGEAFYDFFNVRELMPLSEEEARSMLEQLADATGAPHVREVLAEPGRFAALHLLSGGMPRTLVLLHRILASGTSTRAEDDLDALLDQVTPYYKARFDELPAQSQLIVDALAMHWHPMTAIDCAVKVRIDVNTVSGQLARLVRQGMVAKLPTVDSAKLSFLISERFFAIWYSMRASRRLRRKLIWLVEAVQVLYGQKEVERRAQELLSSGDGAEAAGDPARLLAYAGKVEAPAVRAQLELRAVHAMIGAGLTGGALDDLLDADGEDRHLVPLIDRVRTLTEIRERIEQGGSRLSEWRGCGDWIVSHPLLSLRQKQRISRMSVDDIFAFAIRSLDLPTPNLCDAVGRGAVPSLPDAADHEAQAQIAALVLSDTRSAYPPSISLDQVTSRAFVTVVMSWMLGALLDSGRHPTQIATQTARGLFEAALNLQTDESVVHLADAANWKPLVALGMAGDLAAMIAARGWQERLLPVYEALLAVADGRRTDLVHLAPEVRKPAEQLLAEFLAVDRPAFRAYGQPMGKASRAAEPRSSLRTTKRSRKPKT